MYIPSTLKDLGYKTFGHCHNLKSIIIPNGTEQIGEWCFCGSKIEEITLPKTLKTIESHAFYLCHDLKKVVFAEGSRL